MTNIIVGQNYLIKPGQTENIERYLAGTNRVAECYTKDIDRGYFMIVNSNLCRFILPLEQIDRWVPRIGTFADFCDNIDFKGCSIYRCRMGGVVQTNNFNYMFYINFREVGNGKSPARCAMYARPILAENPC